MSQDPGTGESGQRIFPFEPAVDGHQVARQDQVFSSAQCGVQLGVARLVSGFIGQQDVIGDGGGLRGVDLINRLRENRADGAHPAGVQRLFVDRNHGRVRSSAGDRAMARHPVIRDVIDAFGRRGKRK